MQLVEEVVYEILTYGGLHEILRVVHYARKICQVLLSVWIHVTL